MNELKLREALETIAKLHIIGPMTSEQGRQLMLVTDIAEKALAASKQEPQAQAEPSYWEEEARRYAGNADFWREQCAKKDAALEACVDALGTCRIMSKDNDGNYTIEVTPKIITSAIKQAKDSLK